MWRGGWSLAAFFIILTACQQHADRGGQVPSLTPATKGVVEEAVRRFALQVAQDVTREGPSAWRKYLANSPSFFMAVNGHLVFRDGQSAAEAIPELARTIKSIELRWEDDLRVDPLTHELAVVASSWYERRVDAEGNTVAEEGFFTGLAEKRNGQWQFRNVHWSAPVPDSK